MTLFQSCRVIGAAAVLASATPVLANPFEGAYKPAPTTDCTLEGGEGGPLRVKGNTFYGVESQCAMTRPVNVRDMDGVLYDMVCTGEGSGWTSRALFLHAADGGLILAWDGFAFKYERCPDQPVAGTVTTSRDIGISQ